jgi:hypothetical protein
MVGRNIDVTITSSEPLANAKPLVCFRWKLKNGKGQFEQAESAQIVPGSPVNQQARILKVSATVPSIKNWPLYPDVNANFTEDPATAIAEVRVLLFGADATTPLVDVIASFAVVGPNDLCNVPRAGRTDIGTVGTSKNWQPVNGEIDFTTKTFAPLPNDIQIRACFRWKLAERSISVPLADSAANHIIDRQPSTNTLKLAVTVPDIGRNPDRTGERRGYYGIPFLLMPQLDVRVLFFDNNLDLVLDAWTVAWVTLVWFGAIMAALTVGVAFWALWWICQRRFTRFGKTNPILCLITGRSGFASLSQFQIMLWTFLVIASAAYVLTLSGTLIPITSGTLVLLGISGGAAIISKAKSESAAAAAPVSLDTTTAAKEAARAEDDARKTAEIAAKTPPGDAKSAANSQAEEDKAKAKAARARADAVEASVAAGNARAAVATAADKVKAEADAQAAEAQAEKKRKIADKAVADAAVATRTRHPLWSDLVMEEVKGRELDVTRVQMLYFTLVTAVFVALMVATSYEIPEIPEGYLILMGISNTVYLGSKLTTKTGG